MIGLLAFVKGSEFGFWQNVYGCLAKLPSKSLIRTGNYGNDKRGL